MSPRKFFFLFLFALSLGLAACASMKQPAGGMDFYILEYPPPETAGLAPLPVGIRVRRFSVAPEFNTRRMIYRKDAFHRDAYVYHEWRVNPGDLVTWFLNRDLRKSGLFKAVLPPESDAAASHVLEGSVDEFLEWDGEQAWEAVLSVSVILMSDNEPDLTKGILFQKSYTSRKPCERKDPGALAAAMSLGMEEISGRILRDVYEALGSGDVP